MPDGQSSAALHEPLSAAVTQRDDRRLRTMLDAHLPSVWRALRRFGLPPDVADDAAQRVFLVASRRMADIEEGAERSFLLRTALRVAYSERRTVARRREVLADEPIEPVDEAPGPDELIDRSRARMVLDETLGELEMDLRVVFVLFEVEGLTVPDIAKILELPVGTASSRLRRAREDFEAALKRRQARRLPRKGGTQ